MEEIEVIDESVLVVPDDKEHTFDEQMAIECVKKVKNPFRMLTVENVMKDLNICRGVAYKIFQREDFPSINVGKTKQIMLVSYILWKMTRKEW